MKNVVMPLSAVLFSILLFFAYISKKRVDLKENRVYLVMIIAILIDSILSSSIQCLTLLELNNTIFRIADILNRIDFFVLLIFASSLFLYTYTITVDDGIKKINRVGITLLIINVFIFITYSFFKITFITNNVDYSIKGDAVNIVYVSVGIYLLLSLLVVLLNIKRLDKRHIPLGATIILALLDLLAFSINPYLVIIPTTLTFINYIMYFTIENPDVKMLKQVSLAKEKADRSNQIKDDFLASMSAEVRTPLNAIMCLSEDNLTYGENVPKEVVENSKDIVMASHVLLEVVSNILDMNKIESNQMDVIETKYNLSDELYEVIRTMKSRIGDKNITFHYDIASDVPYELVGDKDKIKEIVNNLLTNAIKFTEKGEINLSIKCINDTNRNICNLYISCQDTGRGIKTEEFNKMFNKFERLGIDKEESIQGTGLGLSITKALVEMMGGNITVSSQFGKGSIFIVNLPQKIKELTQDFEKEKAKLLVPSYGKKKILIIDSDKVNIKVAKKTLSEFDGIIVDECYEGVEAPRKVVTGAEYDLILMSIAMDGLNGFKTLELLKENPTFDIPVIALTNDTLLGDKERFVSEGFYDSLIKSFKKDQIKEKFDSLWGKKEEKEVEPVKDVVFEALSDPTKPLSQITIPNSIDVSDEK